MESISLEQVSFVDSQSAILALRNLGNQIVDISRYSVNGRPEQGRSSPVIIRPGDLENLPITIYGQDYKFENGRQYEVRVRTHRQNEFIFKIAS